MRNAKRVVVMAIVAIMVLSQVGSVGARRTALPPSYTFQWKGYTWQAISGDYGWLCFDSSNVELHLPTMVRMRVTWNASQGRWCGASIRLVSNLGYGRYLLKTWTEAPYQTSRNGLLEGYFLYRDQSNSIVNEHYDRALGAYLHNARFVAAYQGGQPVPGAMHEYWDETSWSYKLHQILWLNDFAEFGEWYGFNNNWVLNQAWNYSGAGVANPPLYYHVSLEVHRQDWVPYELDTHLYGFCFAPGYGWCGP